MSDHLSRLCAVSNMKPAIVTMGTALTNALFDATDDRAYCLAIFNPLEGAFVSVTDV